MGKVCCVFGERGSAGRAQRADPVSPGAVSAGGGGQLRRSLAAFSKSSRHGVSQRSEANWESGKDQNGRRRTMGENKKCRGHKLKSLWKVGVRRFFVLKEGGRVSCVVLSSSLYLSSFHTTVVQYIQSCGR